MARLVALGALYRSSGGAVLAGVFAFDFLIYIAAREIVAGNLVYASLAFSIRTNTGRPANKKKSRRPDLCGFLSPNEKKWGFIIFEVSLFGYFQVCWPYVRHTRHVAHAHAGTSSAV